MGIASIETALRPMEAKLKVLQDSETVWAKEELNRHMSEIVALYEKAKYEELEEKANLVLGAFIAWRKIIEEIVRHKIVS